MMVLQTSNWAKALAVGITGAMACMAFILPASAASTTNVNVIGYSVVGPAFKLLETNFQHSAGGQGVSFTNSFGASDTETNNVVNGQAADIVNLSYESNVTTLVKANLVPSNWKNQELTVAGVNAQLKGAKQQVTYHSPGIVTNSVVVFIVPKGNPRGITGWSDLTKPGTQIVTPNPATSGSAKWNLLAGYAGWIALKHTPQQAQNYLKSLLEHTVAQPTSGATALSTFLSGTGNVLLDYEDDAQAAVAAGDPITIVVPPQTLLIQNPIALTNTGLNNPAAQAFYKYLFTPAAQGILTSLGYRSVLSNVWSGSLHDFASFTAKTKILNITNLNKTGWSGADPEFFGSTVTFPKNDSTHPNQGIVTYLEQFAGQSAG
jgi:sulfate transport system substrate-binding protein